MSSHVPEQPVHDRARRASLALCLFAVLPLAAAEREEARALSRGDGRLLYREVHYQDRDGDAARRVVLYRCPDGAAFARKIVRAQGAAAQPDYVFHDGRSGYREGVRTRDGRREVFVQPGGGVMRSKELPVSADMVIDTGFDAAVRTHWRAHGNAPQQMSFLVADRLALMPVRVTHVGDVDGMRRLRLTLDRWFGFVVEPIELRYGLEDRRLREFVGPSSVRDARGRPREVRIVFPAELPKPVSRADVDTALAVPLEGRCIT